MSGVILFVTFLIIMMLNKNHTNSLELPSVTDVVSIDTFIEQFTPLLRSLQRGTLVDAVSRETADLLRHHLALTDEDKELPGPRLIAKHGYPVEQHEVVTRDGYHLVMFRIPRGGAPVLVVHGVLCSADVFVTSGRESLAFSLADAGHDVWLANTRGNVYSRKHDEFSPDEERFWNFTFHEIGIYDLPACIDHIKAKTDAPRLHYVGHSAGTAASYVLLSERPEYNSRMGLVFSLAPIAYLNNLKSPPLRALVPFREQLNTLAKSFGMYELFSNQKFVKAVKEVVCGTSVTAALVCGTVVAPLFGFDPAQINFTTYPEQVNHVPAGGTSTKEVIHFAQEVPATERFQKFDYGELGNLKEYGSGRPPRYDVSAITAAVVLMYSDNDYLSSEKDVQKLASELPNLLESYKVPFPFNHVDYLWGKDAKELVYDKILELLQNNQN